MQLPLSHIPELSPNRRALALIDEVVSQRHQLRVQVTSQSGAMVIDCGVHAEGGYEAGVLFSKICLGGLADVSLTWQDFGGLRWLSAEVVTDHPLRACMASQYAGWPIKCGNRIYMGSGPAGAVVHKGSLYKLLGYQDPPEIVILCLESNQLPTAEVIGVIVDECGCAPENLTVLVAPTASVAGTVQVAARALETGLFKLRRLGYDLDKVVSGAAACPVSPVARDTASGLGRTNDAISYGATVSVNVRDEDAVLRRLVGRVPASAAEGYGRAYMDFEKGHDNFFNRGPDQFNPAVIRMCSLSSGNTFAAGVLRPDVLRRSFGISE
ncbi:methenyltetrahydromethanopterin cyclohydrolase [Sporobacter termitidis DSM 10068]|uniref:Methenyltetrahydromethanopterin cyclohydrolase n=1 Tax=Sporobacter termitidis DSM 10068 TaxID=1123282 RepID=A0A1M5Y4J3_9FIRM|nr:methenyltetrahydromethanopterin cyclohydrolase [Sporobacter termitidis]SHI07015.1 methenyltetrahydromethanopterin cyclohydrolase [Sporobacter termitidis DSM 10068]